MGFIKRHPLLAAFVGLVAINLPQGIDAWLSLLDRFRKAEVPTMSIEWPLSLEWLFRVLGLALLGIVIWQTRKNGSLPKEHRLQQENPEWFIKPFISNVDLLPDPMKDVESANYINLTLGWDNRTLQEVSISNIKGTLSIDGAYPPCDLPASVPDYNLKPLTPHLSVITVTLTRESLRAVRDIRQRGYGRVNILLKLSAQMKLKQAGEPKSLDSLPVGYTAYYVNEGVLQQLHSISNVDLQLRTELVHKNSPET